MQDYARYLQARNRGAAPGCRSWQFLHVDAGFAALPAPDRGHVRAVRRQHPRSGRRSRRRSTALWPRRSRAARLSPGAGCRLRADRAWISLRSAIPGVRTTCASACRLEDDFKGNTIFNAAGRLDFTELNSLGAESRLDLQVGTAPLLGRGAVSAALEHHALFRRPACLQSRRTMSRRWRTAGRWATTASAASTKASTSAVSSATGASCASACWRAAAART